MTLSPLSRGYLVPGLEDQHGDFYLTAPLSLTVDAVRSDPMAFPNNAFLLSTIPQNPVFVSWHQTSREYLEHPVYTMDEMKGHPTMRRVKPFIGHPDLGPTRDLAPYVCNLWTLADTLYFEPAVRSYVQQHVYVLPTLMWTMDYIMIDLNTDDPTKVVPYKVYTSESWWVWLQRIPNALSFIFGDSKDMIERIWPVTNAMKVSSDLCLWWNQPLEFHLGQQSNMGRAWRKAVDPKLFHAPANLEGIYRWIPFDDEILNLIPQTYSAS